MLFRSTPPTVKIAQLLQVDPRRRKYPYALTSLLEYAHKHTTARLQTEPEIIRSFEDPRLFDYPFIYVNVADRPDWELTALEVQRLRRYLERGGFLFLDAGITASFLRGENSFGQHHSFAEWEAAPRIRQAFKAVFPVRQFKPLKRRHEVYRIFYQGLPEPDKLPDTVREFVVREKWPQGTYSMVGLRVNDRLAVLCSPIIAMGWGRNQLGYWQTTIGFRIREGTQGLDEELKKAAYSGTRFETGLEDGAVDIVYCQPRTRPAWVHEPNDRWRVFRYYHSREISEFAHNFYTRLGCNILVYALTH